MKLIQSLNCVLNYVYKKSYKERIMWCCWTLEDYMSTTVIGCPEGRRGRGGNWADEYKR